jgi:hypothetical protein
MEKEELLNNIRQNQEDNPVGGFLASIDAEVQRTQVAALEQKNATLEHEKQQLAAATDEANAKNRALKNQMTQLRNQLHGVRVKLESEAAPAAATGWQLEKAALEKQNAELQSDIAQLRTQLQAAENEVTELRTVVPEVEGLRQDSKELRENYNHVLSEKEFILEDRRKLQDSLTRVTEINSQLYEKTRQLESNNVSLQKTNSELMESNMRYQDDFQKAISKNQELSEEKNKLEKENNRLQKQSILLKSDEETLIESKTALETEVKNLQAKASGSQNPDAEKRYQNEQKNRIDKLLKEKDDLMDERRRLIEQVRVRDDKIMDLQREISEDRLDLQREARKITDIRNEFLRYKEKFFSEADENEALKMRLDDTNKRLEDTTRKLGDTTKAASEAKRNLEEKLEDTTRKLGETSKTLVEAKRNLDGANKKLDEKCRSYEDLNKKYDDASRNCVRLQNEVSSLQARLTAAQLVAKRDPSARPPMGQIVIKTPSSSEMSMSSPDTPPARIETHTGPKRKAAEVALPQSVGSLPARPATANFEKRQKLDPPPVTSFKRRGAVYLVKVPTPINQAVLHAALSNALSAEIAELCKVFKPSPKGEDQWVVRLADNPKSFVGRVAVTPGIAATLSAPVGAGCPICDEEDDGAHDIMDCRFVGVVGQDRPTIEQFELMHYRPPPTGPSIDRHPTAPKEESSPRSLFERVSFPNERRSDTPKRPISRNAGGKNSIPDEHTLHIQNRCQQLITLTQREPRRLFSRLSGTYIPKPDEILGHVGFGPVASINILERVCFLDFVYPADAALFLSYAERNPHRYTFYDPHGSRAKCVIKFQWSRTAVEPLDDRMARGVVAGKWTRVLIFKGVSDNLTPDETLRYIQDICTQGRDQLVFWIPKKSPPYRDEDSRNVKDLMIEFMSIKDAESAFRLFEGKGHANRISWGVEDNVRVLEE